MDPHNPQDQLLDELHRAAFKIALESETAEPKKRWNPSPPEGTIIKDRAGRPKYKVMKDGSWRRISNAD
jgi:hypothetical protein